MDNLGGSWAELDWAELGWGHGVCAPLCHLMATLRPLLDKQANMFQPPLGCAVFAGSWCSSWQSGIGVADAAILHQKMLLFFTKVRGSGAMKAGCAFQHLRWLFQVRFAAFRGLSGLTCHHLCIFNQFLLAPKLLKGSVLQRFVKLLYPVSTGRKLALQFDLIPRINKPPRSWQVSVVDLEFWSRDACFENFGW